MGFASPARGTAAQEERLAADRHLLFLHRFEQRRLHLGGRAIDLVRQHQLANSGPFLA